jgi:hypothetical protein
MAEIPRRNTVVTLASCRIRIVRGHHDDGAWRWLSSDELAGTVMRALSLPEIVALRPNLLPELPVYTSTESDGHEQATYGIADAIALGPDGKPHTVVDWKSDINPTPEIIEHYRSQVRAYVIADNRTALNAGWDVEILKQDFEAILDCDLDVTITGFDFAEIDLIISSDSEAAPDPADELPALPATAVTQLGDIWTVGPRRLICGDATKPECPDLVPVVREPSDENTSVHMSSVGTR